jgi:hypothetical protein
MHCHSVSHSQSLVLLDSQLLEFSGAFGKCGNPRIVFRPCASYGNGDELRPFADDI